MVKDMKKLLNENKIKRSTIIAFLSAVISGFFCHLGFFINRWANEDSFFNLEVEKNMISSGRWMPGNILSEYTSPIVLFIIVLISLGLIAIMIEKMFKIEKTSHIVITSSLISTFPILALSFGYTFMIERYMLGLVLAVLSVYLVDYKKHSWILGSIFLAISLGYYQSYITVAIILSMLKIIQYILTENKNFKDNIKYAIKYILMGICGIGLYLLITKLVCFFTAIPLSGYKGIDTMGSLPPLSKIPFLAARTYLHVLYFFLGSEFIRPFWYARIPQIILCALDVIFLGIITCKNKIYKDKKTLSFLIILILLLPLGLNILDFILYNSNISSLNLYQFVFVLIMPFILLESVNFKYKKVLTTFSLILAILVVWNNFSISNLYYNKINDYNTSTMLLTNRIYDRLESTGNINKDTKVLLINRYGIYGDLKKDDGYNEHILLDQGLWDRYIGYSVMPEADDYKFNLLVQNLIGVSLKKVTREERLEIMSTNEFESMPSWPDRDSIKYIDDVLVVKVS